MAGLQTQSLPVAAADGFAAHARKPAAFMQDPSLGTESVISSEAETDCESDRGSGTPLRDHQSRLEAYMARKGMRKSSAFQQRFGSGGGSRAPGMPFDRASPPCCGRGRQALEPRATTTPVAIPSKTNEYKGWDVDSEACACGRACGFLEDDDSDAPAPLLPPGVDSSEFEALGDMIFDLEI